MPATAPRQPTPAAVARRPDVLARLAAAQAERVEQGLLRRVRTLSAGSGMQVWLDGKPALNFASNDYLGLARHPALIAALRASAADGVGATAAHLLGGHRDEHAALEEDLARWTGRERALLFSCGYMANLGVITSLLGRGDVCVQDKRNHASLLDAARLAGCVAARYQHADVASAARQLDARAGMAAVLVSDGVFSMDGDLAPLPELAALCRSRQASLMIDDAHGIGVLGAEGAGSVAAAGLGQDEVPVLMGTLGKALGVAGAFVAGSTQLIEGLQQFARSYIYTTALPPALAAATRVAVNIAREDQPRRQHLQALIGQFRSGANARGLPLLPSSTPIQPVLIGCSARAVELSARLLEAGFFVPAIRPPTVAAGSARLRITLSAAHTGNEIERLLDALRAALNDIAAER